MLSLGRFFPNLIRRSLQKILITGKQTSPFTFSRCLTWQDGFWLVEDRLTAKSWSDVVAVDIGGDRTSIYVVMSRTFQLGQLQPAWNLSDRLTTLEAGDTLELNRSL